MMIYNQHIYDTSPIRVRVILFLDSFVDVGHIGIKAWVPGTMNDYHINFVKFLESDKGWIEKSKDRAFEFESARTLKALNTWHLNSPFYQKKDWRLFRHNCADAVRSLLEDFFGYDLHRIDGCFNAPFSTCLWLSSGTSVPRNLFAAAKKIIENTKPEEQNKFDY